MKEEILSIASDLREGSMSTDEAKRLLLILFRVVKIDYCSCSKGKGIDYDQYDKAYCIDCGKSIK